MDDDIDIDKLQREVLSGDAMAEAVLGFCYMEGFGVEVDYPRALNLLKAAVARGLPRAAFFLGSMYAKGLGTEKNVSAAVVLYELAASRGELMAHIALARLYATGVDVPLSRDDAGKWYSAAIALAGCGQSEDLDEARAYVANWRIE
jgi:TPR repeat protein